MKNQIIEGASLLLAILSGILILILIFLFGNIAVKMFKNQEFSYVPYSGYEQEAVTSSFTRKPVEQPALQSLSISHSEIEDALNEGKLVGHIDGQIFYVHKSLTYEEGNIFIEVMEDNRGYRFKETAPVTEMNGERMVRYTPSKMIDHNGDYYFSASKDAETLSLPWRIQKTETMEIGEYYFVKTGNKFKNPVFAFANEYLGIYYPRPGDLRWDEIEHLVVFNSMGGTHFHVE